MKLEVSFLSVIILNDNIDEIEQDHDRIYLNVQEKVQNAMKFKGLISQLKLKEKLIKVQNNHKIILKLNNMGNSNVNQTQTNFFQVLSPKINSHPQKSQYIENQNDPTSKSFVSL